MPSLSQREVPLLVRRRLTLCLGAALLGFLLLLGRLWYLQIVLGSEMRASSENNRIRLHRVQATRGTVVDRYGRVMIDSRPSFDAVLVPEDSHDISSATSAKPVRRICKPTTATGWGTWSARPAWRSAGKPPCAA